MILSFWKARRARALRDDTLAAVRNGLRICENADYRYLSENDRQATTETMHLFELLENLLELAETYDEILEMTKEAREILNSEWFKHLSASNAP